MSEETKKETTAAPAAETTAAPAERPGRAPYNPRKRMESRRKVCKFCADKTDVDYKNLQFLKTFTMESGKILSRRITGACAKHQRQITTAIKRDRNLALMPYSLPKK